MFSFLGRLFVALAALLAMRLLHAAARRASSEAAGSTPTPSSPGAVGGSPRSSSRGKPSAPPRIDRSDVEDVPFEELERERVPRG